VDFAEQTTLEAARVLLAAIRGRLDVDLSTRASETTVATLLTEATFAAEDFATQATLEAARVLLVSLDSKDFATAAKQDTQTAVLQEIAEAVGAAPAGAGHMSEAVSSALAPQADATLSSSVITNGVNGILRSVTVGAEGPWRAEIQKYDGTTATTIVTLYGKAGDTKTFDPEVRADLITQAGGTGRVFRAVVKNNNFSGIGASFPIHVTFEWSEE
jgi:hypothetical protein